MAVILDPYDVLQVGPGADARAVRAAYRRLAHLHHPDRGGSSEAMASLNAAYAVLRDPRRRAAHDAARRALARSGPVPDPGAVGRGGPGHSRPVRGGPRTDEALAPAAQTPEAGHPGAVSGGPLARARARTVGDPTAAWPGPGWTTTGSGLGGSGTRPGPTGGPRALDFGRYQGWTLAQIALVDPDFLEWLERMPIGRQYRTEIEACLTAVGRRPTEAGAWERGLSTFARAARTSPRAMQPQRFAFLHRR
ncbi:MAG: DnaJ domain-containing protein [Candidatus Limnocylindrales bacterium]